MEVGVFFVSERQQRLDLILHLIPNTRQAILLRGPEQSGKSFFIRQFKAQAQPQWRICSINNNELMGDEAFLQTFANALGDEGSGKNILSRLEAWDKANKKVIVCVEDAHLLDEVRFNFLFDLAENYSCVQLLLTSSENLGDAIESQCQLVDIEPFTQKQTSEYARTRHSEQGLAKSLDFSGIDELVLFIETGGLPGLINNTLEQMSIAPPVRVSKNKFLSSAQLKWGLLGLFGVLSVWLVLSLYQQGDSAPVESVKSEVLNHLPQKKSVATEPVQAAKESLVVAIKVKEPVKVHEEPVGVSTPKEEKQEREAVKEGQEPHKLPKVEEPLIVEVPKKEVIVNQLKPVTKKQVPLTQVQKNHRWIADRKGEYYTLQLLGVSTEQSADKYIAARPEVKKLLFFQNKRNSGAWYSVIHGEFSNLAEAEKRAKNLPKSLGHLKPWLRRFEAIKADVFVEE